MFIDLVSNYDLVTHSIATTAFRRVGMPAPPILCMFTSLQNMVHSVRTAYGDSLDTYGGNLWVVKTKPPPQGLGQGNGGGPTSWALVSTPLLNAIRDKGYGAVFKCSISKGSFKLVGYCFVDDSTMVHLAPSPTPPTHLMVEAAQNELDLYTGLARATGGQVSPENGKNSWYLLEYKWDKKGKWSFANNKGDIFVKTKAGRVKVVQIPCDVVSKILGVWIAPNGDNKKQEKELKDITLAWADRVRSGHLRRTDVWHYYQTTIQKSLEYPLLAMTLSEKQCKNIERPALEVALQLSSLPSNFPRDVLHGPLKYLGNGATHIYPTQGIKHIRAIMDHGCSKSITGGKLRAIIEMHKVELGTRVSLFTNNFNIYKNCTTDTWVRWTWGFLWENQCVIEERTPNLSLFRENDQFLMPAFVEDGWRGRDLETLNMCRKFLQICTVSDITTCDGKYILDDALEGRKYLTSSPHEWPVQGKLNKQQWKLWKTAVRSALDLQRNDKFPKENQLGRWLNKDHDTGWRFLETTQHLYKQEHGNWVELSPLIERRGKGNKQRFSKNGSTAQLPADSLPTMCKINKKSFLTTGSVGVVEKHNKIPSTFTDCLNEGDETTLWALADVHHKDEGKYIADQIRKGKAIAVSDGSYKNQRSAAACVIEGKTPNLWRITATASSPGEADIQDAYRGELTGLYMVVLIIHKLCIIHKIKKGRITIACDGLNAIKKGFDEKTSSSCRSSHFDLISAIKQLVNISPLEWIWRNVPGYQDDYYGPLDRWFTLNVEMDGCAKKEGELMRKKMWEDNTKLHLRHGISTQGYLQRAELLDFQKNTKLHTNWTRTYKIC